jgi:DNA-binding NarL/FixJ family response regulator
VSEVQVIEETATAAEALRLAEIHGPDLLMLDAALSDPNFEMVKRMKEKRPQTLVLLVSDSKQGPGEVLAAEAGASGWLARNWTAPEILNTIRQLAPHVVNRTGAANGRNASGKAGIDVTALTPREQQILRLLMDTCTSRDIAEALSLSIKTVEAHKFNLMRKLDVHSRSELIKLAIRKEIITLVKDSELEEHEPA